MRYAGIVALWLVSASIFADVADMEACLGRAVIGAPSDTTVAEIKSRCSVLNSGVKLPDRIIEEQVTEDSAFVITPHRQNYLLPFSHNANPNQQPWLEQDVFPEVGGQPIQHKEAKMQLSLKVPLWYRDLFVANDGLYFGFTFKSFWQVYHNALSKPFRETNYRPELFYQAPLPFSRWDGAFFTRVGIEHESNGRSQLLSRSWNRIFVGLGFLRERWAIYLQPWYRIAEDPKEDDGDPNTPPP
ncbi:MAG: phospholipase A, partial [Oleiphilaceae bacterium]|nr:phospholipase A [Oleiphilaceae bacterium]